jgi:mannose-1-phosphate guanylyltransferase
MVLKAAILVGGAGTRLWPLSTPSLPKPFVSLGPLGRLYPRTLERARALAPGGVMAVGSAPMRPFCESTGVAFLEEPFARNTTAAVALAAVAARRDGGEGACLVVLPSDHLIPEVEPFARTVRLLAGACLQQRTLGIMGIRPTGPETAYGYVVEGPPSGPVVRVRRFVEKPDRQKAHELLASGRARWNSGIFCLPVEVLREEMAMHCPAYWQAAEAWHLGGDPKPYEDLVSTSIDYALMERTERVVMVRADFAWSDLGTFRSLHESLPKDGSGNSGWGPGRIEECRDCLVVTQRAETLVRGLTAQVVVETEEGLLAVPMERTGEIRSDVEAILRKQQLNS